MYYTANTLSFSYEQFLETMLSKEIKAKEAKKLEQSPEYKTLEEFDLSKQHSLSQRQFNQLKELTWMNRGIISFFSAPLQGLERPCWLPG